MRIKVTVLLAFIMSGLINAQSVKDKVCLDNTEQFSIASKYVAGENYVIQVGLPSGYSSANKSYPVLYVLDGDGFFGMTNEIALGLEINKLIKEIIIVAISYTTGFEQYMGAVDIYTRNRYRDYLPNGDTVFLKEKYIGKADNFLKFI
jgi:predicted alpha/beta superfamily hydrolase